MFGGEKKDSEPLNPSIIYELAPRFFWMKTEGLGVFKSGFINWKGLVMMHKL